MRHGLRTYELERSCCYDALLLDEERGRLFVGGKNYMASLSLDNISKHDRKVTSLCTAAGLYLNLAPPGILDCIHPRQHNQWLVLPWKDTM